MAKLVDVGNGMRIPELPHRGRHERLAFTAAEIHGIADAVERTGNPTRALVLHQLAKRAADDDLLIFLSIEGE